MFFNTNNKIISILSHFCFLGITFEYNLYYYISIKFCRLDAKQVTELFFGKKPELFCNVPLNACL